MYLQIKVALAQAHLPCLLETYRKPSKYTHLHILNTTAVPMVYALEVSKHGSAYSC